MPIEITRTDVEVSGIRDAAHAKKLAGCRLSHIMCQKRDDALELIYAFDNKLVLENIHVKFTIDQEIESISDMFSYAFLYENEIKELFGAKMVNISLDFGGNLYQTSKKNAFNSSDAQSDGGGQSG